MLISNLILRPLTLPDDAEAWLTQDYGLTAAGGIPGGVRQVSLPNDNFSIRARARRISKAVADLPYRKSGWRHYVRLFIAFIS